MGLAKDVFDEYGNYKYPDYSNSQYTHDVSTTGGALMGMTIDEHIAQLKKLKSFHNGSYGVSINFAIDSIHKCKRIAKAIDKVEEYICDIETDTVKAQGMAQALDIFEQVLGEVEDGNDD